jgi:hypothetical protein
MIWNGNNGTEAFPTGIDVHAAPLYMRFYYKVSPGYQFMPYLSTMEKVNYFGTMNDEWRMMIGLFDKDQVNFNSGIGELAIDDVGHVDFWRYNGTANRYINAGQWYCIEWAVQANTPGQSDGSIKMWVDGKPYLSYTNQNLQATSHLIDRAPWYSQYYGGSPCPAHPAQSMYYDQVVIARQPIGCGTAPADTTPPAAPRNLRVM